MMTRWRGGVLVMLATALLLVLGAPSSRATPNVFAGQDGSKVSGHVVSSVPKRSMHGTPISPCAACNGILRTFGIRDARQLSARVGDRVDMVQ